MIHGVTVQDLNVMEDDRGYLFEILTQRPIHSNPINIPEPFGATKTEVDDIIREYKSTMAPSCDPPVMPHIYIATARPGVAKAWHMHTKQTDRFCIVHGTAKIGMIDLRGPIFTDTRTWCAMRDHDTWVWDEPFHDRMLDNVREHHCKAGDAGGVNENRTQADRLWAEMVGEFDWGQTFMETQTVILSGDRPKLLTIPPFVAHGQMGIGQEMSKLLNAPTEVFDREDPDEIRIPCDAFEKHYTWEIQNS